MVRCCLPTLCRTAGAPPPSSQIDEGTPDGESVWRLNAPLGTAFGFLGHTTSLYPQGRHGRVIPTPTEDPPLLLLLTLLAACQAPSTTGAGMVTPPSTTSAPPAPLPFPWDSLVINEVMTRNASTLMTADMALPDWVEIYNAGDEAVSLDRVELKDSSDDDWDGPPGEEIAPGEHLLIYCDEGEGDYHAPFKLDGDGDELELQVDDIPVDRITTGVMQRDTAWARYPDGGAWDLTARPTPGWTNGIDPGTGDPTDDIFQSERILDVWLTIPQASWDILQTDTSTDPAVHQNLQVPASFAYQGVFYPNVAVHLKGAWGSRRSLDNKAALKVNLNAYEDIHLRTLESVTLNNMVQDCSYMHEYLAYTLFRAMGVPAPRVAWTHLYVNDEYFGLYLWLESVDDVFLDRWYGEHGGNLYEAAYTEDFYDSQIPGFELEEGGDPDDYSDLYAIDTVLDGVATDDAVAELEALFDLDEFLANMAVEALILHWDGYTTANNYRVYDDPHTGRFQIIPWGTDQTFVDFWYEPWDSSSRLFTWCLSNAGCAQRYDDWLLVGADTMDALELDDMMDEVWALIETDAASDPRREHSDADTASEIAQTRATISNWPSTVRNKVAEH